MELTMDPPIQAAYLLSGFPSITGSLLELANNCNSCLSLSWIIGNIVLPPLRTMLFHISFLRSRGTVLIDLSMHPCIDGFPSWAIEGLNKISGTWIRSCVTSIIEWSGNSKYLIKLLFSPGFKAFFVSSAYSFEI